MDLLRKKTQQIQHKTLFQTPHNSTNTFDALEAGLIYNDEVGVAEKRFNHKR